MSGKSRLLVAVSLIALVGLGLYQSGYTGVEWESIKADAAESGISLADAIDQRDGVIGFARMVWMTNSDERLYGEYARLALYGQGDVDYIAAKQYSQIRRESEPTGDLRPYRDVRVEYPPVAVLAMIVPGLLSLDPWWYRFFLGTMNLLLLALSAVLAARLRWQPVAESIGAWRLLGLVLLLGIVTVTRIDLVPVVLTLGAMVACDRKRFCLAGGLTALGVMAKLYPALWGVVFGLMALRSRRYGQLVWFSVGLFLVLGLINSAMWWWAGDGYWEAYTYHGARGIQIESSWASLILPIHLLLGLGVELELSYGSSNLATSLDHVVAVAWPLAFLGLASPFLWLAWMRGRAVDPRLFMSGLVLSFILANKVFSPQYLLWVAPFMLLDGSGEGKANARWFLLACLLSQLLYPRGYDLLKDFHPLAVLVLVLRNGLVAWLWWRTVRAFQGTSGYEGALGAQRGGT